MKLRKIDKVMLEELNVPEKDWAQIEAAISKTTFEYNKRRISASEASRLLGRKEFLSGMSRSAFHWSATRETPDGATVYFDSIRYFKEGR